MRCVEPPPLRAMMDGMLPMGHGSIDWKERAMPWAGRRRRRRRIWMEVSSSLRCRESIRQGLNPFKMALTPEVAYDWPREGSCLGFAVMVPGLAAVLDLEYAVSFSGRRIVSVTSDGVQQIV